MKTECSCGKIFNYPTDDEMKQAFFDHFIAKVEDYVSRELALRDDSLASAGTGVYYDAEASVGMRHKLLYNTETF